MIRKDCFTKISETSKVDAKSKDLARDKKQSEKRWEKKTR